MIRFTYWCFFTVPKITGHVIVGTPGTLTVFIQKRIIDTKHVKVLVLDEADNMLEQVRYLIVNWRFVN